MSLASMSAKGLAYFLDQANEIRSVLISFRKEPKYHTFKIELGHRRTIHCINLE